MPGFQVQVPTARARTSVPHWQHHSVLQVFRVTVHPSALLQGGCTGGKIVAVTVTVTVTGRLESVLEVTVRPLSLLRVTGSVTVTVTVTVLLMLGRDRDASCTHAGSGRVRPA
eukprot:2404410-Rhodomonas_salina.1